MDEQQVIRPRSTAVRAKTPEQAKSVRKDPRRSHVDGMREGKLGGAGYDPKAFHYVWVDKARERHGVEYYEMLGYKAVSPDDGVLVSGRFKTRDNEITYLGNVLMCISREDHRELEQYGPNGDTGLALATKMEKQFVGRKNLGRDMFRGLGVTPNQIRVVDNPSVGDDDDDVSEG
jgi:hypothetical protein